MNYRDHLPYRAHEGDSPGLALSIRQGCLCGPSMFYHRAVTACYFHTMTRIGVQVQYMWPSVQAGGCAVLLAKSRDKSHFIIG
jgi:hypothetical protein